MASKASELYIWACECLSTVLNAVSPWLHILGSFYFLTVAMGGMVTFFVAYSCMKRSEETTPFTQEDYRYVLAMRRVIERRLKFPHGVSKVLDHLYLGSFSDASNLPKMEELGITHVLNCAATWCPSGPSFYGNHYKYREFKAEDSEDYNMFQHFEDTYEFIEDARKTGGIAIIHCMAGINRSAVMTLAYIMVLENVGPITALQKVLGVRGYILSNESFQKQLIQFAKRRQLLDLDKDKREQALAS